MTAVRKIATWVPVTDEMLADAAPFGAFLEYRMLGASERPLTLRERLTGHRYFTARSGYRMTLRVGWRATAYWLMHPLENWRRKHPRTYHEQED